MTLEFIAQIFGLLALITEVISIGQRKQKQATIFLTLCNIAYGIQYLLLNALSGAATSAVACVRCLVFLHYTKRRKDVPMVIVIATLAAVTIAGIFTVDLSMPITLVPILSTYAVTITTSRNKTMFYHISMLLFTVPWIFYNLEYNAYFSLATNVLCGVMAVISIVRYYILKIKPGQPVKKKYHKKRYNKRH